ncbi:WD40 repeat-like protein [Athelia psychrophila]|uniref:WD40 repeat-like protein n=1 Tax=Athelia psychrophila TaxID=1759441 RepID=A0A166WKX0_9AGAM|nr:WD40 repeat-like protein [Fibularhizoctonia sp. CBS 109695]
MSYQDDLDPASVGPEFIKEGADWLAIFNPKVPRPMDVTLTRKFVHSKVVCSVRLSADALALAVGLDGSLVYYDLSTEQKFTFQVNEPEDDKRNYVRGVAFSPDGKYLASGSEDRLVRVWDLETKSLLHTLHGHRGQVYDLVYSTDGKFLLSACGDRTIRVWDVSIESAAESIESACRVLTDGTPASSDVAFTSVSISHDGHFVAGGSLDGVVRVWDLLAMPEDIEELQGAKLVARLKGHEKSVYSVKFVNGLSAPGKGEALVTGSLDRTLRRWNVGPFEDAADVRDDTCVKTLEGHRDYILATSAIQEGLHFRVASASRDGQVRVWDLKSGQVLFLIQGHKNAVTSLDLSKDGKQLVTGSGDCEVRIWRYNIH